MKKLFLIIIFVLAIILSNIVYISFRNYNKIKDTDLYFLNLVYELYVSTYYDFPESDEHFKKYFINVAFNMDRSIEYINNNPLIDYSIHFTQFLDIDSLVRIRATLSKKIDQNNNLINNAVPLEDYTFFHYITNSKSVLLFDHIAWKCSGRRLIKLFAGSEPDKCFDEQEIKINSILKGFYDGQNELLDMAFGSQNSCYHIKANKNDSTFLFSVECLPQDSLWIDQKGLEMILDSLQTSFNIPELKYVDYFYFPLVAKNSILQQKLIMTNEMASK